jgi:uncharacterized repeat protein (TIGR01451 family)
MVNMKVVVVFFAMILMLAGMPASVQAQSETGLVGEWHFDGDAKDSSGNGNDGTIYGATFVDGKFGKALSFDGVDDYVNTILPYFTGSDEITISAWIKTTSASQLKGVVMSGETADYGTQGLIFYNSAGKISGFFGTGIYGTSVVTCTSNINDGKWHFIVATHNSNRNNIYVDGVIENDVTASKLSAGASGTFGMGAFPTQRWPTSWFFPGSIDEVHIYNRALSAEEVKANYEGNQTALSITKTASPTSIKQGQTTTITLTVKNTGSTEIGDIEIADAIPKYLILIDGEKNKTYASLSPQDSRQFQYSVQINEAGTFNLGQATASYSDNKGNYQTIKSKPASIEVIPSLVTDSKQTPSKKSNGNAQSASVNLHGEKTDVELGENVLLKLSAVNIIGNPAMHVQVIIIPPSGWSVTSSEFAKSGAGQYTTKYDLESGDGKDIEVRIIPNQIGEDFKVEGRIVYYFGDDIATREDHTLDLPIKVRAKSSVEISTAAPQNDNKGTPGFAFVVGLLGLVVAMQFIKRK